MALIIYNDHPTFYRVLEKTDEKVRIKNEKKRVERMKKEEKEQAGGKGKDEEKEKVLGRGRGRGWGSNDW